MFDLDLAYKKGLIPRKYYYQLKDISAAAALQEQRKEILAEIMERQKISAAVEEVVEKTIEDLLKDLI